MRHWGKFPPDPSLAAAGSGPTASVATRMLYFAYGSNMSRARLQRRVASAHFVSVATLRQHALRFHKRGADGSAKCDAFFSGAADDQVIGVVFRIEPDEKPTLDRAEGLGTGYQQKSVEVVTADRRVVVAFTYCATDIDPQLKPFHWYKAHVLQGCRDNGLPSAYARSIAEVASIDDPDPARAARERAIYD